MQRQKIVDGFDVADVQLTKNIWKSELRVYYPDEVKESDRFPIMLADWHPDIADQMARQYQLIRDHFNRPISFSDVIRPRYLVRWIDGAAPTSRHLTRWLAKGIFSADFTILGVPYPDVFEFCDRMMNTKVLPQGGLGLYNNHIHMDNRGRKARW